MDPHPMDSLYESRDSTLELSREEQWVVHHVMLDRIELEQHAPETTDAPSIDVYRVFDKLDAGDRSFSARERRCIEDELRRYVDARDTPACDRSVATDVLEKLQ